ncbi:hypothetical protein B6I21_09450 [candidate division KSB1 bacterium 4572_119]|nr:MAG: hypothetical protein B6I21_09450 [candidate division KSB1 bacterium 4572_119]
MGNVVDRCWTNSVNDSRCQNLEVKILGSATKYGGESLMGGDFFFGGLNFDQLGNLRGNERPYLGTKMFGGASRGNFLFFDPEDKLVEAQYIHGIMESISDEKWEYFDREIRETFALSNIKIYEDKESEYIIVNGARVNFSRDNFKLIVPRGGLKGYESH